MPQQVEFTNRIRPLTKAVAAIIIPFLLAAFGILYFIPGESGRYFAWEIQPAMTAVWMGAGYLGGAYFFVRVLLGRRWHHVAAGFWSVTIFTWAMLAATWLHWSRFDPDHAPFRIWLVLYLVTPLLVPLLWWYNQAAADGTPEPDDVFMPVVARGGMALLGLALLVGFLIAFFVPDLVIAFWPWTLTPLTARVMGGWFALMGVGGLLMAGESRWSGWRIGVESIMFVWHGLVLVGAIVHRADFGPGTAWFYVAEATAIAAFVLLYRRMEKRRSSP